MYINNEIRVLSELNNYSMDKCKNFNNSKSVEKVQNLNSKDKYSYEDSINLSTHSSKINKTSAIGSFTVDKGTAANTTVYVSKATYNEILNYSTNNPNCHWDEMGFDGEKKWVVINGQRFEYPLSKEEKDAIKEFQDKCNIFKVFEKEDKKIAEKIKHKKKLEKFNLSFDSKGKCNIGNLKTSSTKINNLLKNDKVMKMLSDISAMNSGTSIELLSN